jgi:DNA polymerase elongation subunit (family B)
MKNFHGMPFDDYVNIINSSAAKYDVPIKELQEKVIQKDVMVRFVNQELNRYLGRANGDKVIQIGTVFWRFGEDKPFHNNIITLKGCAPFNVGDSPCEVISHENELDVLIEWSKLIENMDPDIILGYNIFGFDESFMYDRIVDLLIRRDVANIEREDIAELESDPKYSRFMNMTRLDDRMISKIKDARGRMVNKKLASSALGENFLYFFNMPGRVQIDLLKVCQASLDKLPSYKLDDVAEHYISGKIKDFYPDPEYPDGSQTRIIKIDNMKEVQVGNYVTIGMTTTTQKLYDGEKLIVKDLDFAKMAMTLNKPIP